MIKYIRYFRYLLWHKYYVLQECWKRGLYWLGITHDISKFLPSEWLGLGKHFIYYRPPQWHLPSTFTTEELNDPEVTLSRLRHTHKNKHHWQWWVFINSINTVSVLPIPEPYRTEMICDWIGAAKIQNKFSPANDQYRAIRNWYTMNKNDIILHADTRKWVENYIGYPYVYTPTPTHSL